MRAIRGEWSGDDRRMRGESQAGQNSIRKNAEIVTERVKGEIALSRAHKLNVDCYPEDPDSTVRKHCEQRGLFLVTTFGECIRLARRVFIGLHAHQNNWRAGAL